MQAALACSVGVARGNGCEAGNTKFRNGDHQFVTGPRQGEGPSLLHSLRDHPSKDMIYASGLLGKTIHMTGGKQEEPVNGVQSTVCLASPCDRFLTFVVAGAACEGQEPDVARE